MKLTGLETFLANAGLRNYLFLRLRTDTGLTGVGEASLEWQERSVQTLVHESAQEEEEAVARVEAVRAAVGPRVGLMIEFHGRLSAGTAVRLIRRLEPFDPAWCEEPVAPECLDLLAEVKRQVRSPLAAGERLYTLADFARLAALRAADVVQMGVPQLVG